MSRIYRSTVLEQKIKTRKEFDPSNSHDVSELKYFIEYKKWRNTCPFISEGSYDDIFITCLLKYAKHMLLIEK
jgi:hypothetical protein